MRPGGPERHLGAVDAVLLAVDERDPHVDHRVAVHAAAGHRLLDALGHGRDVAAADGAADDLVDELEALAALERLDLDAGHRELAVAAGLLLVLALGRRPAR